MSRQFYERKRANGRARVARAATIRARKQTGDASFPSLREEGEEASRSMQGILKILAQDSKSWRLRRAVVLASARAHGQGLPTLLQSALQVQPLCFERAASSLLQLSLPLPLPLSL